MSALQSNIERTRRILAKQEAMLEQQKREAKEKEEKSWEFNMDVLEASAKNKEEKIARNRYGKHNFSNLFQDKEMAPFMKACINCLKRLDERLNHIERFLRDDVECGYFLPAEN